MKIIKHVIETLNGLYTAIGRNIFPFSGRITRQEFWAYLHVVSFVLQGLMIVKLIIYQCDIFLATILFPFSSVEIQISILPLIWIIFFMRSRLHDHGYSTFFFISIGSLSLAIVQVIMSIPEFFYLSHKPFYAFAFVSSFIFLLYVTWLLLFSRGTIGKNEYGSDILPKHIGEPYTGNSVLSEIENAVVCLINNFRYLCLNWSGRLNRREYFYAIRSVFLVVLLFQMLCLVIENILTNCSCSKYFGYGLMTLNLAITFVFISGPIVRRLHDHGLSASNKVFLLIPLVNVVLSYKLFILRGEKGNNRYGADTVGDDESDSY